MGPESSKQMEDCKEIFRELSEYLDAELSPDQCRQIEAHLSGCEQCVEFVRSLRRTIGLCRGYKLNELPGPLNETVRAKLLAVCQKMLAARKTP